MRRTAWQRRTPWGRRPPPLARLIAWMVRLADRGATPAEIVRDTQRWGLLAEAGMSVAAALENAEWLCEHKDKMPPGIWAAMVARGPAMAPMLARGIKAAKRKQR